MARPPKICACCREYIFPGYYYTEFENETYCNTNCLTTELVAQATPTDYREFVEECCLDEFKEYLLERTEFSRRYYHTEQEMRDLVHEE